MASLEVLKALSPLRECFQRDWFARWIKNRAGEQKASIAERQLIELATGGDSSAFYSMPPEDLGPQIILASQIALDDPKAYMPLLVVLFAHLGEADITLVAEGPLQNGSKSQEYMYARERAARRIQRNIDGARLTIGNRWKLRMQLASISMTVLIIEIAVCIESHDAWNALLALPLAVIGGYLAPISRDLVAALQQLRDP